MRTAALLALFPAILAAQDRPQFVWQGEVDGVVILHVSGQRAEVQVQEGAPVQRQQFHFNDPLPETAQAVRLTVLQGRGSVRILDQPKLENHYTLAVAIEDRQPGSALYSIALSWDTSNRSFEGKPPRSDKLTWSGRIDREAVISCQGKTCASSAAQGAPVAGEHFKFSRPLPDREVNVRLEEAQGRGEIRLVEQPRQRNNYTARVSIRDPQSGAGEYSFTLVWNHVTGKEPPPAPEPPGRGLLWSGTVDGRVRVTVQGGASFSAVMEGGPIRGEHAELLRPLPARSDLMPALQKLRGRGAVAIVEAPSEKNNYGLTFEINDPEPGADMYEIEVDY